MNVDPAGRFGQPAAAGTPALRTNRLLLRRWRPEDRAPFARLNADPAVMEFFPHPLTAAESDRLASHGDRLFDRYGYGLWAVEVLDGQAFTSTANFRSRRVMEKIGMHRDAGDDFDHPRLSPDDPLLRHVLYRLQRDEWAATGS